MVPAFGWAQAGAAGSSANPEQPAAKETPVFRTNANLVVVDVVVRDKGQPVHGLKAADFQIREDGKEQKISVFEEHSGTDALEAAKAPQLPPHVYSDYPQYARSSAANVLLLDALNTPLQDQVYVRRRMLAYLKTIPAGTGPDGAVFDPATKTVWAFNGRSHDATVIDTATNTVLATVASGGAADVDRAVAAARRAFEERSWADMNPHERTLVLLRIADAIEAHREELATLESLDGGIPITLTRGMVAEAAKTVRYYAGWPTKISGTVNPVDASVHCYTVREPLGVCAGIIPWNGPLTMAVWKIAPALACGNTVILKPAEQTPLTALRFGEILAEAGLPAGVVNVVTGFGETAGAAISGRCR